MKVFKNKKEARSFIVGSTTSFRIFSVLSQEEKGASITSIHNKLGLTPGQINHYIRNLENAGIVKGKKLKGTRGNVVLYGVNPKGLAKLWEYEWKYSSRVQDKRLEAILSALAKNEAFQEFLVSFVKLAGGDNTSLGSILFDKFRYYGELFMNGEEGAESHTWHLEWGFGKEGDEAYTWMDALLTREAELDEAWMGEIEQELCKALSGQVKEKKS